MMHLIMKCSPPPNIPSLFGTNMGQAVAWVTEALCYKLEGRGFEFI
jgi:hypothetical protein